MNRRSAHSLAWCAGVALLCSAAPAPARGGAPPGQPPRAVLQASGLQAAFVENRGQWDLSACYVGHAGGFLLAAEQAALVLRGEQLAADDGRRRGCVVRLEFEGASAGTRVAGEGSLPGARNYLMGNDRAAWRTHVPAFASVRWSDVRDGIEVTAGFADCGLEYALAVRPGADLEQFAIRCIGTNGMELLSDGSLLLHTALGPIRQSAPIAWQERASGDREDLACAFRVLDATRFGFTVPARDASRSLSIGPGLQWSTYVGGTGFDFLWDSAQGADGRLVLVGETESVNFPVGAGGYDLAPGGKLDAVVAALDGNAASLLYTTYLGGALDDRATNVVLDAQDRPTILGTTATADFPVTSGAFDQTLNGPVGIPDAFVTRLAADGATLVYSTFVGGALVETTRGLAGAFGGDVILAGITLSPDFPATAGAFQQSLKGPSDMFIARLKADGSALAWSTWLGGSADELPFGMALAANEDVVMCGKTTSLDFPYTPGAWQTTFDVPFVARLQSDGSALLAATSFGGSFPTGGEERPTAVTTDQLGNIVVVGYTLQQDFPTTPGVFKEQPSVGVVAWEGFLTCFDPQLGKLQYSTFLGGTATDSILDVVVDDTGAVVLSGTTNASDFTTTAGCFDALLNGPDVFVARLSPGAKQLWYSTLLGGSKTEVHGAVADHVPLLLTVDGGAIVGNYTLSSDFPTTAGTLQPVPPGGGDMALTRLDLLPLGCARYGTATPGPNGQLTIGVTCMPQVGSTNFAVTCGLAPPASTRGYLVIGLGALATPVTVGGASLWVNQGAPLSIVPLTSDGIGACVRRLAIPPDPSLAGWEAFAQILWVSPATPTGKLSASRALAITIQP